MTDSTRQSRKAPANGSQAPSLGVNEALDLNELVRILIAVAGRVAFPLAQLQAIVSPGARQAYYRAYSMCNGQTSMAAIAKETGIDPGELSRAVSRWVDAGIAFRVGTKSLPLHLYPLASGAEKTRSRNEKSVSGMETKSGSEPEKG